MAIYLKNKNCPNSRKSSANGKKSNMNHNRLESGLNI